MFEAYVEIGVDNIVIEDICKGFASFLVVALGGTGEYDEYFGRKRMFVKYQSQREMLGLAKLPIFTILNT